MQNGKIQKKGIKKEMVNDTYAKAYKEVLEIIKYFPKEEYNRIPKERIEYYKNNMDKNYKFTINPEIDLSEQNVSKEAGAIIVTLFRDYFATEEQRKKLEELIKLNEKKSEIQKKGKYNSNDIFKEKVNVNNDTQRVTENNLPIEIRKENFFKRLINYIKSLFI